jgi:hypothetical protein
MEATLPISAGVKPASPRAARPSPPDRLAASVTLPLRFIVAGLLSLFIGALWLVAQPNLLTTYHYNQNIIALTHLFVLGWICSVVMGVLYQLIPVALETSLYSEKLARWQFAFHAVGFIGMVWMFRSWNLAQVGHFGSVMAVGVGLFVFNIGRTLARAPKWNVVATAIAAALGWLSLTVLMGLALAASKGFGEIGPGARSAGLFAPLLDGFRAMGAFMARFDAIGRMHAHAHLGIVGVFTMLIVGVSFKLVPMFALSEVQNPRRAGASVILLNVGLAGAFISILLQRPWKPVFALIIAAALVLYGCELRAILRARKRARLDGGMKAFLTALAMLMPLSLLGLVLCWPGLPMNGLVGQLENLYGFLGLIGFVSFAIIGMLHKIVPFLIWFASYSRHVGRARVPALADLCSEPLQLAGYWSWLAGLSTISAGILLQSEFIVRSGAAAWTVSLALFAGSVAKALSHLFRPVLKPISGNATA